METIKRIVEWIVVSSEDPTKLSLTVKGFLGGLVTVATFFLGLQDIVLDQGLVRSLIDQTVSIVQIMAGLVSALAMLYGGLRKVTLTATGEHPLGGIIHRKEEDHFN